MPLPDFFIMLDKDPLALQELKNLQVPLIGFVDTNMNPEDFIYKLLGNNDSVKNLEFLVGLGWWLENFWTSFITLILCCNN